MPADFPTLHRALIVNDEVNDSQGQLSPGNEAVDGDGFAVITVVRSMSLPTAADVRPYGQFWFYIPTQALYWSRGGGLWFQIRDTAALPAHQATHRAGGDDALPWMTIHGNGTLLDRPVASAANAGYYYDTVDTAQLFRSTGTAWVELGLSALAREYTHHQGTPATGWVVNHNLGRRPKAVAVLDSAGTAIIAPYQHISINQLVVTFGRPSTGSVIVG